MKRERSELKLVGGKKTIGHQEGKGGKPLSTHTTHKGTKKNHGAYRIEVVNVMLHRKEFSQKGWPRGVKENIDERNQE